MDMEHKNNYCEHVRDTEYHGMIPGVMDDKVYHYDDKPDRPYYKDFMEKHCEAHPEARITPKVELFWKDCHHLSNNGTHTLYVVVKNPYEHLHLKNVKVILKDLNYNKKDDHGDVKEMEVPKLPDGCEAVELRPQHSISFGDLGPCGDEKQADMASREIVLFARCAPHDGFFKISAYSCFEVEFSGEHSVCFELYKCGC